MIGLFFLQQANHFQGGFQRLLDLGQEFRKLIMFEVGARQRQIVHQLYIIRVLGRFRKPSRRTFRISGGIPLGAPKPRQSRIGFSMG